MALSVDDVFRDPTVLKALTPADFDDFVNWGPMWRVQTLGRGDHKGQGWLLREYRPDGGLTGRMIKWHPGGGHHGREAYWRVSSAKYGRTDVIR